MQKLSRRRAVDNFMRTDVLSNRELAKQNGVSDGVIRNRAKAEGWQRDLKAQVRAQVSSTLALTKESPEVRTEVRKVRTSLHARVRVRTDASAHRPYASGVTGRTQCTTNRGDGRKILAGCRCYQAVH